VELRRRTVALPALHQTVDDRHYVDQVLVASVVSQDLNEKRKKDFDLWPFRVWRADAAIVETANQDLTDLRSNENEKRDRSATTRGLRSFVAEVRSATVAKQW